MAARVPRYSLHKATGQARVVIDGRHHYLGPFESSESKAEYSRFIERWRLRQKSRRHASLTVGELVLIYDGHVSSYYVKNGKPTSEVRIIKSALTPLARKFSRSQALDFGPLDLKAVRDAHVKAGHTRSTCNAYTRRIVALFRWAVENQFVPVEVYTALKTVSGLRKGRTKAKDRPPVKPVSMDHVRPVRRLVSRQVRTMIDLQLIAGMRPGEVCIMRPQDIDRSEAVWQYRPYSHKLEHKGIDRIVFLGPKAQRLLRPWLDRPESSFLFSPREAERDRAIDGNTRIPVRSRKAKRAPREHYSASSYGRAIARACEGSSVPVWRPNRLRHTRATGLRKLHGIEVAGTILGHAKLDTTAVYAEKNLDLARKIMAVAG